MVRSESGSVSIYFIAAAASFVLLTALLIDFARIAAFRKQAESAVHSGVRSVLSSYDPVMYARYGLFIRGGEDGGELFRHSAERHFAGGAGSAFPYLDAEWTDMEVTESRPLADHEVFRRQVLEEMKYKAPIDLTLEFAERFRGLSPAMKEAAATTDMLEQMRKAYDQREAALDDVSSEQQTGGRQIVAMLRDGSSRVTDIATVDQSGKTALAVSLADAARRIRSIGDTEDAAAKRALLLAREANAAMRAVSQAAAASSSAGSPAGNPDTTGAHLLSPEQADSVAKLRQTAQQLVLEEAFFDSYSMEIETQKQQGNSLAAAFDRLSDVVSSAPTPAEWEDEWSQLQAALQTYAASYGTDGSVIHTRQAELQAHRSRDGERKALENEARSQWSGWSGSLRTLTGRQGSSDEREAFRKADEWSQDNLRWNEARAEAADHFTAGGPSDAATRAMNGTSGQLDALQISLAGTRDSVYFAEYSVSRFSHMAPSQVKRMLAGEEVPLPLAGQETEYGLYGFANPSGNIAAAYSEVFAVRLAIRTMEGLIECRTMGHPLVILAAALVYGIRNALLDMNRLLERDIVPLSKYVNVDTKYADYLRLILLLHGGTTGHISRTIAVIESAAGIRFSEAYTYVSGEGTASLRLWFFPGLLKIMSRTGQLGGTVKGNRYEAVYSADSSYQ